jgi:hypothetical protein
MKAYCVFLYCAAKVRKKHPGAVSGCLNVEHFCNPDPVVTNAFVPAAQSLLKTLKCKLVAGQKKVKRVDCLMAH